MSFCMHQAFKSAAGDTLENEANQITKINKKTISVSLLAWNPKLLFAMKFRLFL